MHLGALAVLDHDAEVGDLAIDLGDEGVLDGALVGGAPVLAAGIVVGAVTAAELAREVSLRPRTIMNLARAGKIPRIKLSGRIVRFDREAVLSALRALGAKKN